MVKREEKPGKQSLSTRSSNQLGPSMKMVKKILPRSSGSKNKPKSKLKEKSRQLSI